MSIGNAIYNHLISQTVITDLLSTSKAVFPAGDVPQAKAFSFITFQRISSERAQYQQGTGTVAITRMQIDSLSEESLTADLLAEAVRSVLGSFVGLLGANGETVEVFSTSLDDEAEEDESPVDGRQKSLFRIRQDWVICHEEPDYNNIS